jgi:uncharacterized protein DUF6748
MLRTLSFATLFATSILAGCTAQDPTQPGTDELAGENGQDGEVPKADGVDNFGFMAVTPTQAVCSSPLFCVNYNVARVNRSTTQCWGGSYADHCGLHGINWDALNLSAATKDKLEAAISHTTSSTGPQVLVRGTFKNFVEFTELEPTEVWIAQRTGNHADGTFVRIFDRGIRCITAPCPQFEEGRLNSTREMAIDGIDFGTSAEDSLQENVYDATTKPDGVIILGDRTTRSAVSFVEKLRSVNQVFLPITK